MGKKASRKKVTWHSLRLAALGTAMLLIVIAPVLNNSFHFSFIQGWYQSISIGNMWFVSPLEGLESILTSRLFYMPLIIGMTIPVLVALLLGRVFCSWICPVSFLSETIDIILLRIPGKRYRKTTIRLPRPLFWVSLFCELFMAMVAGVPIFVFLSPPGLAGREIMMIILFKTVAVEGVVLLAVLLLHILSPRLFCRYLCPLGALLAIIGSKRRLHIKFDAEKCVQCGKCSKICPLDLKPVQGETLSAYCWNCGECTDVCSEDALEFNFRPMVLPSPPMERQKGAREI